MTAVMVREAVGFPSESEITATVRLAKGLVESGFLPRNIDTPAKAVALMLTGREMGLGPMAAIRAIAIVEGKPVLAADLQLGLFKRAGGRATFTQLDTEGAVLRLTHPNGDEHVESYMMADAKAAGLLGKANWTKYPKAMYRSRVITAGLKSVGFEPMAGVYDPEELEAQHITVAQPVEVVPAEAPSLYPAPEAVEQAVVSEPAPSPFGNMAELVPEEMGADDLQTARARVLALLDDEEIPQDVRDTYRALLKKHTEKGSPAGEFHSLAQLLEGSKKVARKKAKEKQERLAETLTS